MAFRQHPMTAPTARSGRGRKLTGLALVALLPMLVALLLAVHAPAGAAAPHYQAITPAAGQATTALPAPVRTDLPAAVSTSQALPAPVASYIPVTPPAGGAATAITPGTATGSTDVTNPPPVTSPASSDPPWAWIIGGLVLLAILAGAAYMFTRRAPATPALVPITTEPATARLPDVTSAPLPAGYPPAAPVAPLAATAALAGEPGAPPLDPGTPLPTPAPAPAPVLAPAPVPRATVAPTMVKCPNCDTMNPIDRRYCDECGQDLRAAVAAALAGPLPEVEATTPYLETLSRVDEQLEFVLARDLITIGRGLDNDIVIDDQFMGWQTVSPRHAELRRTPNGFVLRDLNSENGTFVNSARTGENLLQDGMTLAFGKVEFIYRVPTE